MNAEMINRLADEIHSANSRWWTTPDGQPLERNVGELLMLAVSELSEAMEGDRKNLMDDHLPHRKMIEVELADAIIRILDMAAGLKLNVGLAMVEKLEYNKVRKDHTWEHRLQAEGKKY